jgi:hypothetical protein
MHPDLLLTGSVSTAENQDSTFVFEGLGGQLEYMEHTEGEYGAQEGIALCIILHPPMASLDMRQSR